MYKALRYFFLIIFLISMVSCNGPSPLPPAPPIPPVPPPPVTSFQVSGANIVVKGQLKAGTKVTAGEAKAAVGATVKQLESK